MRFMYENRTQSVYSKYIHTYMRLSYRGSQRTLCATCYNTDVSFASSVFINLFQSVPGTLDLTYQNVPDLVTECPSTILILLYFSPVEYLLNFVLLDDSIYLSEINFFFDGNLDQSFLHIKM